MIILTDKEKRESNANGSKGNQLKFKKDDIWYKADGLGCEGLAETVSSNILKCSNCSNFTIYTEEKIKYNDVIYNACKSDSFTDEKYESVITSSRIAQQVYNKSIREMMRFKRVKTRIELFVDKMSKATGIHAEVIGKQLTEMLELDAFILNNDRHFNNIAYIYNEDTDEFTLTPIYDNGAAFMSYKEYYQAPEYIEMIDARPFSKEFDEQKEIAESLFGKQLKIRFEDFSNIMPLESIYEPQKRINIMDIIKRQARRYQDLVEIVNENNLEKSFVDIKAILQNNVKSEKYQNLDTISHNDKMTVTEAKNAFGNDNTNYNSISMKF